MSLRKPFAVWCAAFALVLHALPVLAQSKDATPVPINIEVPIPISEKVAGYADGKVADLANYIAVLYNFTIATIGLVAAVMMILGGFQYLTSAGDAGKVGGAKKRITDALIGLVLALGAYALLNTINPALLTFKPLGGVIAVQTELSFLPWCEDIIKGDPTKNIPPNAVTPYGSANTCGYAGKYTFGNQEQTCIYAGTCRIEMISIEADGRKNMYRTCMQKPGLTNDVVKKTIAANPSATFGECLGCADLTTSKAQSLGYRALEPACQSWEQFFSRAPSDLKVLTKSGYTIRDGLFHICYLHKDKGSCVGAFIDCFEVTRNQDDGTRGVGIPACSRNSNTCGCEGYDEEPTPIWTKQDGKYDSNYKGPEDHDETMLGRLCDENPCKNYLDPVSSQQSFIKGCKGNKGLGRVVSAVQGGFTAIGDCGNN